jgi:hypothetical protein
MRPDRLQLLVPALLAAGLVLAGVGVGAAIDDDGPQLRAAARPGPHPWPAPGGGPPGFDRGGPGLGPRAVSPGIRAVLLEIRRAMKDQAPRIADPIIDRAVGSKRITAQQADRIRERLERRAEVEPAFPPGGPRR